MPVLGLWGTREWNWGFANGLAHDEAFKLRSRLSSPANREAWLKSVGDGEIDQEEVKLCLALKWQRAGHERRAGGYLEVMDRLASGEFENANGLDDFCGALKRALPSIGASSGDEASLESGDQRLNALAVTILLNMNFLERGL